MMYIKGFRICDEDSPSYSDMEYIVTDGTYEVECYSYGDPYAKIETFRLTALYSENIMLSEEREPKVEKLPGYMSYRLTGVYSDGKIIVGDIAVWINGNVPGDISDGDCITLECKRLDLFER